jgi:hypothetical protein
MELVGSIVAAGGTEGVAGAVGDTVVSHGEGAEEELRGGPAGGMRCGSEVSGRTRAEVLSGSPRSPRSLLLLPFCPPCSTKCHRR